MEIREMLETDLTAVYQIEVECFSKPWSRDSFEKAIRREDTIYLVGVSQGEILGYCGIWCSFEDGDLCNMAVNPRYRRQGVGKELLQQGMVKSGQLGAKRILLEVRMSNKAAIGLYEMLGFQKAGIRKEYYSAPKEDALIMECGI